MDIQRLPPDEVIKSGLNLLTVNIMILLAGAGLFFGGNVILDMETTTTSTNYYCLYGDDVRIDYYQIQDGYADCPGGEDEDSDAMSKIESREETNTPWIGYIPMALGVLVWVVGYNGILVKIVADGVSAGIHMNMKTVEIAANVKTRQTVGEGQSQETISTKDEELNDMPFFKQN